MLLIGLGRLLDARASLPRDCYERGMCVPVTSRGRLALLGKEGSRRLLSGRGGEK